MIRLKAGDTLLYKSPGFLPRAIRYFMKKYVYKKYGKKNPDYPICNHMATVIEYNGELYTAEAVSRGYVIAPVHIYERLGESVFVYRPIKRFTKEEQDSIKEYAIQLAFKQTEYEIGNFLWWIVYIATGFKWFIGGKKDQKVFCFESAARCLNASGREYFDKPWLVTSVDIQEDTRFQEITA